MKIPGMEHHSRRSWTESLQKSPKTTQVFDIVGKTSTVTKDITHLVCRIQKNHVGNLLAFTMSDIALQADRG